MKNDRKECVLFSNNKEVETFFSFFDSARRVHQDGHVDHFVFRLPVQRSSLRQRQLSSTPYTLMKTYESRP